MKTKIISIVVMLLIACNVMAQDYMRVYFKDGNERKFYLKDITSITTKKLDADGIQHSDYEYQHITTHHNKYVYNLNEVDSITFSKFNEEEVSNNINLAMPSVFSLLDKCKDIKDTESIIDALNNTEGIENSWCDGHQLYVKIFGLEPMTFHFHHDSIDIVTEMSNLSRQSKSIASAISQNGYNSSGKIKAVIANQRYSAFYNLFTDFDILEDNFRECGIDINYNKKNLEPTLGFFMSDMFSYDLIFLVTHGGFDGRQHWLLTSTELGDSFWEPSEVKDDWFKEFNEIINSDEYITKELVYGQDVDIDWTQKTPGGDWYAYIKISENLIKEKSQGRFPSNNSILFNGACLSLYGGYNLANILLGKGLGVYFGYDESTSGSSFAGCNFFNSLLYGKSVVQSYDEIPKEYRDEKDLWYALCDAKLLHSTNKSMDECQHLFLFHTITSELDQEAVASQYKNSKAISFQGFTTSLDPQKIKCGFLYSTDKNLSTAKNVIDNAPVKGSQPFADGRGNVVFRYDIKDLQPGNTYYYCAYTFDGEYYNCGDTLSFYVPVVSSSESYAVYNAGTLTFYHDQLKNSREGSVYSLNTGWNSPGWYSSHGENSKVVFDKSFADARPTSTCFWFTHKKNLTSIEGIEYLNTSEVTVMHDMFGGCENLTSLDVSNFDTRNVAYMAMMFEGCENLTSLDVSSFDTRNVKDMVRMFSGCENLTSLDVSNFDTRNVKEMADMFGGCENLTSLDVSNFDTRNVTNMHDMFYGCENLTSLDVSSFDTRNVKDMSYMFTKCYNLTSLDVSNFDTRNVTNMDGMFYGCISLYTLDVSNFNMAACEKSESMFAYCDGLNSLAVSFTMENLDESACEYVGYFTPCTIIAPDGFNFGVDTSGESFTWKSGTFKLDSGNSSILTFTVNGVSFKMVAVEGGTFMMGASDDDNEALSIEKPQHQVTLSSYYIGQVEVTQELWNAVMGTNPSDFKSSNKLPVECVSWDDCQRFIAKLNNLTGETFSLPTEAQWEFAARGGNNSNDYTYSGSNSLDFVAWYNGNSGSKTHNVATKVPNELGIFDMSGNVSEWCQDYYGKYSSNSQTNPTGPSSGSTHIYRGGFWNSYPNDCTVYKRYDTVPNERFNWIGLRLVL